MRRIELTTMGLIAACLVPLACTGGEEKKQDEVSQRSRSQVKLAIGEGASCAGACDAQAEEGCWCDEDCHDYGDCCADKVEQCGGGGALEGTCREACGGQSDNGNCWCDHKCQEYNDCCRDKAVMCGRPPAPPEEWTCNATYYDAQDGCDCACGAYDPDCQEPESVLYNCGGIAEAICNQDGQCESTALPIPEEWTCDPSYYATVDGCDCECGAYDPDCDSEGAWLHGCEDLLDAHCNTEGRCEGIEVVVPETWTCDATYYQASDGCDCNCGAFDPDCEEADATLFGCDDKVDPTCSAEGVCVSAPGTEGWTCTASFFQGDDGCDCGCGAYDPDCDDPEAKVYGCDDLYSASCNAEGVCEGVEIVVPEAWTCDAAFFAAEDGCDCNCGAYDLDCDNPEASVWGCGIDGDVCSSEGRCVSPE